MAIWDFLTGGKAKRAQAAILAEAILGPVQRLHNEVIHAAGVSAMGERFEAVWESWVHSVHDPDRLAAFPVKDFEALDQFVTQRWADVRALLPEIEAGLRRVLDEWRYRGLVIRAAKKGLEIIDMFEDYSEATSDPDRRFRTFIFFLLDVATSDVLGELAEIANGRSRGMA